MNAHSYVNATPANATLDSMPRTSGLPTYDAKMLTQQGVLAQILLNDQTYILRITRAGKLILTK